MNTHEYKSWKKRDADQATFIYRQMYGITIVLQTHRAKNCAVH